MFEEDWNEVKKQVSIAALGIRAAANVMMDSLDVAIYDIKPDLTRNKYPSCMIGDSNSLFL